MSSSILSWSEDTYFFHVYIFYGYSIFRKCDKVSCFLMLWKWPPDHLMKYWCGAVGCHSSPLGWALACRWCQSALGPVVSHGAGVGAEPEAQVEEVGRVSELRLFVPKQNKSAWKNAVKSDITQSATICFSCIFTRPWLQSELHTIHLIAQHI